MPRKPQEKARRTKRKRTFGNQAFYSTFPTSAPVMEGQEVDVFINDIGNNGDDITQMQSWRTLENQDHKGWRKIRRRGETKRRGGPT